LTSVLFLRGLAYVFSHLEFVTQGYFECA